jgi:flagellar protein FliS
MRAGRMAEKGVALNKAVLIIGGGLKEGLDMDNGGALAIRLAGHYDAMMSRLTRANLHNDEALLAEVDQMLKVLEEAWRLAPSGTNTGTNQESSSGVNAQAVGM